MPDGTYCMAVDKPEQVLDVLKESAVQAGLELNREISLYMDIGADSLYDSVCASQPLVVGCYTIKQLICVCLSNICLYCTTVYGG